MTESYNRYCVYIHRNTTNNKAYIGITINSDNPNKRWQNGNGYAKQSVFYNAILKYGWDNFEHIVWGDGLTLLEAQKIETMLISLFNTTNHNFGYNVSTGGDCFSLDDVGIIKRSERAVEAKNQKRISKTIEIFQERFENGDENVLRCQKCGAYFEKAKGQLKDDGKRSASKKEVRGRSRKYCDYCATYHKRANKIVVCVDCGKEFVVKSKDTKTHRCEECKRKR